MSSAIAAPSVSAASAAEELRPVPSGVRAWALVSVLGLVNVTVGFRAMFAGVAGLATGTAAVLANAQPVLILLPAWWLYGEVVSRLTVGALVVGFAGLVLAFVSLVGSAAAFVAWFTETLRSRLDVFSAWTFLTPVFGIALGAVVLVEQEAP